MPSDTPTAKLDTRFSEAESEATAWPVAERLLTEAQLYWVTTVRSDGRPHVTPLVAVYAEGALHFCTGPEEQKARNLESNHHVAMTTGNNTWNQGTDVVVEGRVERVTGHDRLQRLADAYLEKYGEDWRFDVSEEGFSHGEGAAHVFRVDASKALAFAKAPHSQTSFRF